MIFFEKIAFFVTLKKIAHLDFQAILERKFRRGYHIFNFKHRTVSKNEAQITKLVKVTKLTEEFFLKNTIFEGQNQHKN